MKPTYAFCSAATAAFLISSGGLFAAEENAVEEIAPPEIHVPEAQDDNTQAEIEEDIVSEDDGTDEHLENLTDGEMLIEWRFREGDNPEIYYMTSGQPSTAEGAAAAQETSTGAEANRATVIVKAETATPAAVEKNKSGPVALVKEGRVFLR